METFLYQHDFKILVTENSSKPTTIELILVSLILET